MKFLVKWTKEGSMRFISHLDIMRLFQRSLKRKDIKLRYSEGYSPHPKMSIVQPLSLGYTSTGEYIEFETREDFTPEEIKTRLSEAMPPGVDIVYCTEIKEAKKIASMITLGAYTAGIGKEGLGQANLKAAVDRFMSQKEINVEKLQKKSGKVKLVNIREKVREMLVAEETDEYYLLKIFVDTGTESNLNPELIVAKLCDYLNVSRESLEVHTRRDEMFTESEEGSVIPLYLLR